MVMKNLVSNMRTDIVLCKAIGFTNDCFSFDNAHFNIKNILLISWQIVQITVIHFVKKTKTRKFRTSSRSDPKNIGPYNQFSSLY